VCSWRVSYRTEREAHTLSIKQISLNYRRSFYFLDSNSRAQLHPADSKILGCPDPWYSLACHLDGGKLMTFCTSLCDSVRPFDTLKWGTQLWSSGNLCGTVSLCGLPARWCAVSFPPAFLPGFDDTIHIVAVLLRSWWADHAEGENGIEWSSADETVELKLI